MHRSAEVFSSNQLSSLNQCFLFSKISLFFKISSGRSYLSVSSRFTVVENPKFRLFFQSEYARLTPQERAKRKMESLETLRKTFKKHDNDIGVQEFQDASDPSVEELHNQVKVLQSRLTDVEMRLKYSPTFLCLSSFSIFGVQMFP